MIQKQLKTPVRVLSLEALLRRILPHHRKRKDIEDELARHKAGFRGEEAMQYYLNSFTDKNYSFFHNIRLPAVNHHHYFQLDLLLITPNYMAFLESKNMQGTLTFDHQSHQLIQMTKAGQENGYMDPFQQVYQQEKELILWLQAQKTPSIPIQSRIVVTNSSSIIKFHPPRTPPEIVNKVVKMDYLEKTILILDKQFQKNIFTRQQINKLRKKLLSEHTSYIPNYLHKFQIPEAHLIKGVQCPSCKTFPMIRKIGVWKCPSCPATSLDAHLVAIADYALLLGPTITNMQLRDFLKIESMHVANRLLKSLELPYIGSTKGRTYTLPLPTD